MTSGLAPDDPRHGTYYGYNGLKCRCDECRAANAKYAQRMRRRHGRPASAAAISFAQSLAVTWVRENRADVWQSLVDQAYAAKGVERRPVGRPVS